MLILKKLSYLICGYRNGTVVFVTWFGIVRPSGLPPVPVMAKHRMNMKLPFRLLLTAAFAASLVLLITWKPSKPVATSDSAAAAAPPGILPAADSSHPSISQPPAAPSTLPPVGSPALTQVPRTIQELNQLADSPLPLPDRIAILTKVMKEAPPEQAKAAAVRSVFVVKNTDYNTYLEPLLLSGEVKPEALEVLSLNLYDRPLEVQLPLLAAIRSRTGHPLREMATDALKFHLKDGANANGEALAQVVKDYLRQPNP